MYNAGKQFIAKNEAYVVESSLECYQPSEDEAEFVGYDRDDHEHRSLLAGSISTVTTIESFPRVLADYSASQGLINEWEGTHGEDSRVSIRADFVRDFLGNLGTLTARDISVYCGLLAALGNKGYAWISTKRILAGSHGCKSLSVFEEAIDKPWITLDQVRGAIEKLERRGVITSVLRGKRKAYALGSNQAQLVKRVKRDLAYKQKLQTERKPYRIELSSAPYKASGDVSF